MTSNVYPPSSAPLTLARDTSKPRGSQKQKASRFASPVATGETHSLRDEEWTRLHFALGVCPRQAAQWFAQADSLLRERYQLALVQQVTHGGFGDYALLHDPLEDDPQWRDAFEETEAILTFELELAQVADGPGYCLFIWQTKAHILREEFGLEWLSPAQMNPLRCFA